MSTAFAREHPSSNDAQALANTAARELADRVGNVTFLSLTLQDDAGVQTIRLPSEAINALEQALEMIASGRSARVVPYDDELTTAEAAEILQVSRPHLVKLLEEGAMPFRLVGTHRRVRLADVLDYQERDRIRRREIMRQLIQEGQDLDLGYSKL